MNLFKIIQSIGALLILLVLSCGKSVMHESDATTDPVTTDAQLNGEDANSTLGSSSGNTDKTTRGPSIIKEFSVGGSSNLVKADVGDTHKVVWKTEGSSKCLVKYGNSDISESLSGSEEIKTDMTKNVSIVCENAAGETDSKSIQVQINLVGDIEGMINGFYHNPKWGELLIHLKGTKFLASYNYQKGTVKGTYNPETGLVRAWWCELVDGKRGGNKLEGEAEFIFLKNKVNEKISFDGQWRYDSSSSWRKDWDLDLIPNPDSKQEKIKKELETRLSEGNAFCGSY